jgi:hypothetical protein
MAYLTIIFKRSLWFLWRTDHKKERKKEDHLDGYCNNHVGLEEGPVGETVSRGQTLDMWFLVFVLFFFFLYFFRYIEARFKKLCIHMI